MIPPRKPTTTERVVAEIIVAAVATAGAVYVAWSMHEAWAAFRQGPPSPGIEQIRRFAALPGFLVGFFGGIFGTVWGIWRLFRWLQWAITTPMDQPEDDFLR